MILSYARTLVLYGILICAVRLMGKRQVGEMEPSEFVVTMLVANLASIPMQDGGIPLYSGLVPILTVLGSELLLSFGMLRSMVLRKWLCGKPVILIENGHILQNRLRQTRISLDELIRDLRQKDVLDLQSVQYAILETNGSLSVFPYACKQPAAAEDTGTAVADAFLPVTLVEDGVILWENLRRLGKNQDWLTELLGRYDAHPGDTFLLAWRGGEDYLWLSREAAK